MEVWQIVVSFCAGLITVISFLDKIGVVHKVKKVDTDFKGLKGLPEQIRIILDNIEDLSELQVAQNQALLAMMRNDLYTCFKEHREMNAWTDDECQVQTKIHDAYHALGGNGEETIWWDKKKAWSIYSDEQMQRIKEGKNNV